MSSEKDKEETVIRVITFDGTVASWPFWEDKFLTRANKKGYGEVMLGLEPVPDAKEALDPTKATHKQKLRNRKANNDAYHDLVQSMDTSTAKGRIAYLLVKRCKTDELPLGDAKLA